MQSDNRLRVSRMRCSAKRCTADPGPPRTGTIHASRVYPTCAHWAPISGKPEIGVCRKTGKYRDRPTSAALAAAGERCAFCQTNPTAILAKRTQGPSPRGAPRDARVAGTPLRGPHDHRPVFMGPGSRYAPPGRHVDRSTYGCRKRRPAKVLCFAPVLYRESCNSNVSSRNGGHFRQTSPTAFWPTKAEPGAILDSLAPHP
jgi:hypothetical protein